MVTTLLGTDALTGLDKVKVINSSFSLTLSSMKSRAIVWLATPAAKVTVPELATKSSPAVAVLPVKA